MSIFKDTFKPDIQKQLKVRQDAIFARTPADIQYLNARNSWIRMSSSVNVGGSNELAKKYVLQGGVLANGNQPLSGIGSINNAYTLNTPNDTPHRLGIRPMPGITGIDVRSKSAYGSLREVEIQFNAWDIKQLEELELLYMRPGYTVLIEWGWAPYLDNNSTLQTSNINFYDIINPSKSITKEQIFKDLYDTAVKTYGGNYDAMFGYVKNYSWSARSDGGYDCTTTVISVGEVVESLKVNYAPFNNISQILDGGGLIVDPNEEQVISEYKPAAFVVRNALKQQYGVNILAGLFYEFWLAGVPKEDASTFVLEDKKKNKYNCFRKKINIHGGTGDSSTVGQVGASDVQVYITLESLCSLINNNVTFVDSNSKSSYVTCSVFDREYDKDKPSNSTTPTVPNYNPTQTGPIAPKTNPAQFNLYTPPSYTNNNTTTENKNPLLCLGHPLQISMDPSVCLINNSVWVNGILPDASIVEAISPLTNTNVVKFSNTDYSDLIKEIKRLVDITDFSDVTERELIGKLSSALKYNVNEIKQLSKVWHETNPKVSLYDFLDRKLEELEIEEAIGIENIDFIKKDPTTAEKEKLEKTKAETTELQKKTIEAAKNIEYITKLNPFFFNDNSELGIIGNIYVNVNFLYRLAINDDLESKDRKEQNDISLYDFLKSALSQISSAIGSVNNFDLHVDPIDNIIRIIDINYVDKEERDRVYEDIFTLQIHDTKSVVRTYKLESQIFPEQSTIIAIGAQVGGGAMATDNNTMLDFNKGLEDRIIPKKIDALTDINQSPEQIINSQIESLSTILDVFYGYFQKLSETTFIVKIEDSDFNTEKAGQYKNALRDLIKFFQNLTNSDTKNRSIIPTKLSINMDGIGGLVIGHMFKIPEDLLPKGYKGGENGIGSKLGYTVTNIGHAVQGNDWTTTIDAQTIILDNPSGLKLKYSDLVAKSGDEIITANRDDINNAIAANQNFRINPPLKSLVKAAKQSIGFSTAQIRDTDGGNLGCAAAVSVIFLRATGNRINPSKEIELSTLDLYNRLLSDTTNWRKRDKWEAAKPGDIIITSSGDKPGHTGVVIDTVNADGSYNIISNSSKGFGGSTPGTIQQNYSILKWESIYYKNPRKTTAFEYIGSYN